MKGFDISATSPWVGFALGQALAEKTSGEYVQILIPYRRRDVDL
ncbi:MAG: hypothetical protein ACREYF_18980 [Gammaproteobacteria bacterium]